LSNGEDEVVEESAEHISEEVSLEEEVETAQPESKLVDEELEAEELKEEPKEGELVKKEEEEPRKLPILSGPPSGLVKSAMLTSIRYRMEESAYRSYGAAVVVRGDIERALAYLDDSFIEGFRGAARLANVEQILADDQKQRDANTAIVDAQLEDAETVRRQAEDRRIQAEHQLEMNGLKRDVEMANAKVFHAELIAGGVSQRTQTQDEFIEALFAKHSSDMMGIVEEEIKSKGMADEEADKLRKAAKEMQEDF
jgi:hypothetical protein